MSRERARRRAERERLVAEAAVRRAKARERAERADRRRQRARSMLPTRTRWGRSSGELARRNRRRMWWFVGIIAAVQLVVWPLLPGWGPRLVLLAVCLLAAPVAWVILFDRR
ncbi:MAG: hypothetical protein R2737_05055 [Candidatus Nanopelagicales bacterium]